MDSVAPIVKLDIALKSTVFSTAFELRGADPPFFSCREKTFLNQKYFLELVWRTWTHVQYSLCSGLLD
jgi:hypothetical protein